MMEVCSWKKQWYQRRVRGVGMDLKHGSRGSELGKRFKLNERRFSLRVSSHLPKDSFERVPERPNSLRLSWLPTQTNLAVQKLGLNEEVAEVEKIPLGIDEAMECVVSKPPPFVTNERQEVQYELQELPTSEGEQVKHDTFPDSEIVSQMKGETTWTPPRPIKAVKFNRPAFEKKKKKKKKNTLS
eukprot:TRINITY_DN17988_c0_g1_i1.p1 TRINITY_DN17988_c0_g1~~TRINITY_DN17988_c0_g1_i1.p1  ORF type:complete len:185 (+),score=45.39 TRINITY_DN17988_c0_g1_i1:2-556(+)